MRMLRIAKAEALPGLRLRLALTGGRVMERDVGPPLHGPVFERIRSDPAEFALVCAEGGTTVWPNGADLCPDTLIWNGSPPESAPRQSNEAKAESNAAMAPRG
jgi:hypothetical protein